MSPPGERHVSPSGSRILVAPLSALAAIFERERPSAMVSLQSSGPPPPRPASVREADHLTLLFNDVVPETTSSPTLVPPAREHAEAIIGAARAWDREGPLLIHCWFGISRSPAAAIIAAAALEPARPAGEIAAKVRAASPVATPNAMLIAHGDAALNRGGSLIEAVAAIGRGQMASEGVPFALEIGR